MSAVMVPAESPVETLRPALVPLPPDLSIGVSPPEPVPLSQPAAHDRTVTMSLGSPSRYAIWRSLEPRADRLASWGALAVAALAVVAYVVL